MPNHSDKTLFVALDVESATVQHHICQIGLAWFGAAGLSHVWKSEINPQFRFDGMSQYVHGLRESDIVAAPTFPELAGQLAHMLGGALIVTHSNYDVVALRKTMGRYGLSLPEFRWLDSCKVARQTWPELENHTLPVVTSHLEISLTQHHNALDDAIAAGEVVYRAMSAGFDLDDRTGASIILKPVAPESPVPNWVLKPDDSSDGSLWA
jgi:DNA polymerase-3 subunit epsilon